MSDEKERIIKILQAQLEHSNEVIKMLLHTRGTRMFSQDVTSCNKILNDNLELGKSRITYQEIKKIFQQESPSYDALTQFLIDYVGSDTVSVRRNTISYLNENSSIVTETPLKFIERVCLHAYASCHPFISKLSDQSLEILERISDDNDCEQIQKLDQNRINNWNILKDKNEMSKLAKKFCVAYKK